jgi:CelD/BcsL family acetyltransferase involved in cellulose biosynthesis
VSVGNKTYELHLKTKNYNEEEELLAPHMTLIWTLALKHRTFVMYDMTVFHNRYKRLYCSKQSKLQVMFSLQHTNGCS